MAIKMIKIKDLAEKFIMCDDDFYFINPISVDRFFKDDKPVHPENKIPYKLYDGDCLTCQAKVFYHTSWLLSIANLKNFEDFWKKVAFTPVKIVVNFTTFL